MIESSRDELALLIDPNALELEAYPWPLDAADRVLNSDWLRKLKADTLREALAQGPKKYYHLDLYGHMGAAIPVEWLEDEAARIEGGTDD